MGIILTTINTFFGIFNTLFGIVNTLFILINILFIGGLIFAGVYLGPKIKSIFDGFTAIQTLTSKLTPKDDEQPPCLTDKELEEYKKKLNDAKNNIDQFKNLPLIGGIIPPNIVTMLTDTLSNLDQVPIC
jgi:5-bromo-4-chloroindolyl phosphate hydrolysis protein